MSTENIDNENEQSDEFERESQCEELEDYKVDGYHPVVLGETFNQGQYQVIQKLGWGYFSTVWLINEKNTNNYFALKIQKSKPSYTESAQDELELLKKIVEKKQSKEWSETIKCFKSDLNLDISIHDTFNINLKDQFYHFGMHGKHCCTVFEIMGPSLLDVIEHFDKKEILMELSLVKKITIQLLIALDYMHRICGIIHTDLKPENVMLQLKDGIIHEFTDQLKSYDKKPLSMKFLKKLKSKVDPKQQKKNKKKKNKKKQKKLQQQQQQQQQQQSVAGEQLQQNQPNKIEEEKLSCQLENVKIDSTEQGNQFSSTNPSPSVQLSNQKSDNEQKDTTSKDMQIEIDNTNTAIEQEENVEVLDKKIESEETESLEEIDEDYLMIWKNHKIQLDDDDLKIKIVDFGNGCWTNKHFTERIQTREYRSAEAIIGYDYEANTDIWSLGCLVFELITNNYLFKPKAGEHYSKNEDHLAMFQETLGKIPKSLALGGRKSKKYFNRNGQLINIKNLKDQSISYLLMKEFDFEEKESLEIEEFLLPMFEYDPKKRIDAKTALYSPWLWS